MGEPQCQVSYSAKSAALTSYPRATIRTSEPWTSRYLAGLIANGDKRLIVTTNMMDIPKRLAPNPKVTTLLTGGVLNPQLTGFIGSASISLLEQEKVLHNASYRFLLADRSKFDIRGGYRFSSINDFSAVITDETDRQILSKITQTGTLALCC